jgi:hypothetical protein
MTPATFIVNFRSRILVAAALIVAFAQQAGMAQQAQKQKPDTADTKQQSGMGGISSAANYGGRLCDQRNGGV